ncbi:MAG TPA: DUF177 domain-containing protein [Propionibacteriaceae bacterium]|jgi:uncharacterized protein|nr:DUF177 domain-containing protein [Propionibacteriaceae bacterium]
MSALDRRSGLVLDTHELGRRAGALKLVQTTVDAPTNLGIEVIGVPAGSPTQLNLRLESAVEGVLVTGTAQVEIRGECVRCLSSVEDRIEVDLQELYVYPGSGAEEEEASRMTGDLINLEPLLRDAVVLELPFQPLCRPDCAGLCLQCGANLNDAPGHEHRADHDPRWDALRQFERGDQATYDVASDPRTN